MAQVGLCGCPLALLSPRWYRNGGFSLRQRTAMEKVINFFAEQGMSAAEVFIGRNEDELWIVHMCLCSSLRSVLSITSPFFPGEIFFIMT
mmetsp:Transcript_17237/g.28329  ORF Transcript_17237/g.28329 Transcript_17237/m.28329 type:complete len:90 (-) Transcript_17237:401-670(-)